MTTTLASNSNRLSNEQILKRARGRIANRAAVPNIISTRWSSGHSAAILVGVALIGLEAYETRKIGFVSSWLIAMITLGALILITGHGVVGLWRGALIDDRNKISLSRFQLVLWTIIILSSFIVAAVLNITYRIPQPLSINIPQQLWFLMGISTTSLIGSSLIKSAKKNGDPDPQEAGDTLKALAASGNVGATSKGKLIVNLSPDDATWGDLFKGEELGNGAHLDVGKVQMFFFTLILALAYCVCIASDFHGASAITAFPSLDQGMITLLGISHAGYLANKGISHTKNDEDN